MKTSPLQLTSRVSILYQYKLFCIILPKGYSKLTEVPFGRCGLTFLAPHQHHMQNRELCSTRLLLHLWQWWFSLLPAVFYCTLPRNEVMVCRDDKGREIKWLKYWSWSWHTRVTWQSIQPIIDTPRKLGRRSTQPTFTKGRLCEGLLFYSCTTLGALSIRQSGRVAERMGWKIEFMETKKDCLRMRALAFDTLKSVSSLKICTQSPFNERSN